MSVMKCEINVDAEEKIKHIFESCKRKEFTYDELHEDAIESRITDKDMIESLFSLSEKGKISFVKDEDNTLRIAYKEKE